MQCNIFGYIIYVVQFNNTTRYLTSLVNVVKVLILTQSHVKVNTWNRYCNPVNTGIYTIASTGQYHLLLAQWDVLLDIIGQ